MTVLRYFGTEPSNSRYQCRPQLRNLEGNWLTSMFPSTGGVSPPLGRRDRDALPGRQVWAFVRVGGMTTSLFGECEGSADEERKVASSKYPRISVCNNSRTQQAREESARS